MLSDKPNLFVTGGAGSLGSAFVRLLLEEFETVRANALNDEPIPVYGDGLSIRDWLGWHPRETWESGLRQTIEWYMKNEVRVERIRSGAYRAFHGREVGAR